MASLVGSAIRAAETMATAAAVVIFAGSAAAEPDVLEPVPAASEDTATTTFVDDPTLVGQHPLRPDSFTPAADGVLLHFTSGLPQCAGVHATVTESPTTVVVDLRGGTPPTAVGRVCAMLVVHGTLALPLRDPVGDRQVLAPA